MKWDWRTESENDRLELRIEAESKRYEAAEKHEVRQDEVGDSKKQLKTKRNDNGEENAVDETRSKDSIRKVRGKTK